MPSSISLNRLPSRLLGGSLFKSALSPNGNNDDGINKCAIRKHILKRLEKINGKRGHTDFYRNRIFSCHGRTFFIKLPLTREDRNEVRHMRH